MKINPLPQAASLVTLQTVLDRLSSQQGLSASRRRDLRSAVSCFAKLIDQPTAAIPLDLGAIRRKLDTIEPAWAKISRKRWANIRSDLVAAIHSSGLRPMLMTARIELDEDWHRLLAQADRRISLRLSRFARWAKAVNTGTIERFVAELHDASLVRKIRYVRSFVSKRWNALVASNPGCRLRLVILEGNGRVLKRPAWTSLPASLRADIASYTEWASMPDPLAEEARVRALSPRSLRLQQQHIHSAVSAAVAAGIPIEQLTTLASLVEPETFRAILRQRWQQDGGKLSAYTHGIAITLTAIAGEWVKAPAERSRPSRPCAKNSARCRPD